MASMPPNQSLQPPSVSSLRSSPAAAELNRQVHGGTHLSTRLASCSCGLLTVQVVGEPVRVSICHCLACQRRTGSAFGEQARFPRENASIFGASTEYIRVSDEGSRITFHFCPKCGSTVYYEPEGLEAFVVIPVGAFADPGFPSPLVSVYESRMHQWVVPPAGAEHIP